MKPVIINWKDNKLYLNFTNSIDCSTFNFYYCSTFWNTSHFLDLTVSQDLDYLAFRESQLIRILSRVIANGNHFSTSRGGTSRRRTNTICMAIALKNFQIKKTLRIIYGASLTLQIVAVASSISTLLSYGWSHQMHMYTHWQQIIIIPLSSTACLCIHCVGSPINNVHTCTCMCKISLSTKCARESFKRSQCGFPCLDN